LRSSHFCERLLDFLIAFVLAKICLDLLPFSFLLEQKEEEEKWILCKATSL